MYAQVFARCLRFMPATAPLFVICGSTPPFLTPCVNAVALEQEDDSVMLDLETGKIRDFIKFDVGNLCMLTGGHNNGRVGIITHKEKHRGSFDIVHVKDAAGHSFATRST